jgi:putative ABC transport system permease protein
VAKVAVLGATVAHALFGKADPVGEIIRIADVPVTVVGVLTRKGPSGLGQDQDDVIFVPIATAKLRLFGDARAINPGAVNYVLVKIATVGAMAPAERQITELLRQRHRLWGEAGNDFEVRTQPRRWPPRMRRPALWPFCSPLSPRYR